MLCVARLRIGIWIGVYKAARKWQTGGSCIARSGRRSCSVIPVSARSGFGFSPSDTTTIAPSHAITDWQQSWLTVESGTHSDNQSNKPPPRLASPHLHGLFCDLPNPRPSPQYIVDTDLKPPPTPNKPKAPRARAGNNCSISEQNWAAMTGYPTHLTPSSNPPHLLTHPIAGWRFTSLSDWTSGFEWLAARPRSLHHTLPPTRTITQHHTPHTWKRQ